MKREFDLRVYLAFAKTKFLNKMAYRFDYFMGIFNTCIQLFIATLIWEALYGGESVINGITFSMVVTTVVISQGLANAYAINDQVVSKKVRDGSIAYTMLYPISFRAQIFAESLGEIMFRLISNFLPAIIIFNFVTDISPPVSALAFLMFVFSVTLGFVVLWMISSIVQFSAFWIMNVWSLSTIKNVFITVLSGSVLPLWFMPKAITDIVDYTPFGAIYFIPSRIYLGDIAIADVWFYLAKQVVWIVILFAVSHLMWVKGKNKIVVQGG